MAGSEGDPSVRDPDRWYESCHESLRASNRLPYEMAFDGSVSAIWRAVDRTIWQDLFDGRFDERDYALEVFERHRREVASKIPAERLLVYDIREGWEPLCELLEVPIPTMPFPHLNDRDSFWTRMEMTGAGAHTPVPNAQVGSSSNGARLGAFQARSEPRGQPERDHACISGLALADPETAFTQDEVLALLGLTDDEFAQRIFHRGGIERRRLDLAPELLSTTLQGRTAKIEEQLTEYAVRAVEGLAVDPSEIGTVITSSLYSLGCPTLAHRLAERLEIDPSADRYHILGVGCASAVPLVRLAQQSLSPGKKALIVAAESMSGIMMRSSDGDPRSKTVASSLFGDGCAAMLIGPSTEADGPSILASKVHQIAGTLEAVTLDFSEHDSHLRLIKELPDVAGEHLHELVCDFLAENDLSAAAIDHWLIHPGGRRIIESVQQALALPEEQVRISFEVLANHGNVGTPSIFYVLHRTIEQREPGPGEHGLMVTIGPGVSVGLMLLRW